MQSLQPAEQTGRQYMELGVTRILIRINPGSTPNVNALIQIRPGSNPD